jgi:hypothetical protein
VFQGPAARGNAGNNVDNAHFIRYLHCFQHYLLLQVSETGHAHLIRYLHCFQHYLLLQVCETRHAHLINNAGNNVDIILNVHDVFHESAARDNAGNNVDIL